MFPLVVAGLAAAGLLALMLLIAIARCIAHDQLRRDNLRKSYAFDDTSSTKPRHSSGGDRFTSAPAGLGAARRSIRRALTKKKALGSFARRTQDGSVLVEVGDEVLAVPAHLADGYRERVLRERSELSAVQEEKSGLFGSVKPKYLTDGGPDGGDEEQARAAYDHMLDGAGGIKRTLSQRLAERLRALTAPADADKAVVERSAYSFGSQHQQTGAARQSDLAARAPVVTTGTPGWAIQQRQSSAPPPPRAPTTAPTQPAYGTARVLERTLHPPQPATLGVKSQTRKPAPKMLELSLLAEKLADLEKQSQISSSSSRSKLPAEARLTRPPSSGSASAHGTFGGSASSHSNRHSQCSELSVPGAFPERTRSLPRNKSVKPLILNAEVGNYRHRPAAARAKTQVGPTRQTLERKPTSVPLASPTRFTHEKAPRAVVHPERPQPAASLRRLPVPPPFNLHK